MKKGVWVVGVVMAMWASPNMAANDAMKQIMLGLSEAMTRINAGIWREDFQKVAVGAESIADHPMPPLLQRLKLLAELGADSSDFMRADDGMRAVAQDLKEAAVEERIDEVQVQYKLLHQRCVDCHSWYRGNLTTPAQILGDEENEQ